MPDPPQFRLHSLEQEIGCESAAFMRHVRPSSLRRLMLLLTRGHWSSPYNHGPQGPDDPLACLQWNEQEKDSNLTVALFGTDEAKKARNAAIIVRVGNFLLAQLNTEGGALLSEDNAQSSNVFQVTCQGLWACQHPSPDVAADMAWSTFGFFGGQARAISHLIGDDVVLRPEVVGDFAEVSPEPDVRYRVDFGMKIQFNLLVSSIEESHRLKNFFIDLPHDHQLPPAS